MRITRLPNYLQNRSRRDVNQLKKQEARLLKLEDIVTLVKAADEASDPIYGTQRQGRSNPEKV